MPTTSRSKQGSRGEKEVKGHPHDHSSYFMQNREQQLKHFRNVYREQDRYKNKRLAPISQNIQIIEKPWNDSQSLSPRNDEIKTLPSKLQSAGNSIEPSERSKDTSKSKSTTSRVYFSRNMKALRFRASQARLNSKLMDINQLRGMMHKSNEQLPSSKEIFNKPIITKGQVVSMKKLRKSYDSDQSTEQKLPQKQVKDFDIHIRFINRQQRNSHYNPLSKLFLSNTESQVISREDFQEEKIDIGKLRYNFPTPTAFSKDFHKNLKDMKINQKVTSSLSIKNSEFKQQKLLESSMKIGIDFKKQLNKKQNAKLKMEMNRDLDILENIE